MPSFPMDRLPSVGSTITCKKDLFGYTQDNDCECARISAGHVWRVESHIGNGLVLACEYDMRVWRTLVSTHSFLRNFTVPRGELTTAQSAAFIIRAECHSDDRVFEIRFDALPFFQRASDDAILELARCGWGGDRPADEVAYFVEALNPEIANMLAYSWHKGHVGFEAYVDPTSAASWLKQNRPVLLESMMSEGIYDPVAELRATAVQYKEKGARTHQLFICEAEDLDHAREQCENAYPNARIVGIFLSPRQDTPAERDHVAGAVPDATAPAVPVPALQALVNDPLAAAAPELRARLHEANAAFRAAGGRGVELADFIDAARHELRSRGARKGWATRRMAATPMPTGTSPTDSDTDEAALEAGLIASCPGLAPRITCPPADAAAQGDAAVTHGHRHE